MHVCMYVCITKNQLKTCHDPALRVRSQEVRKFCFESKELIAVGNKVPSTSFNLVHTSSHNISGFQNVCLNLFSFRCVFSHIAKKVQKFK